MAANRNQDPIFQILKLYLQKEKSAFVLEIASGPGQHVAHFAKHFPNARFQPTEVNVDLISRIRSSIVNLKNVADPLPVDVRVPFSNWPKIADCGENSVDLMININMIHISSDAAVDGLFKAAGILLKPGVGLLLTYGAYAQHGIISPDSNVSFDASLRSQDPQWGLRDTDFLEKLAVENGMLLETVHDMPANNKTLIFRKK